MQVNLWQKYRIITCSLWATLILSLRVILLVYTGRFTRGKGDRYVHCWATRMLAIVKAQYRIYNPQQVRLHAGQRYIIMSNHASHYDIPLLFLAFPDSTLRMAGKKELFRVPIWGHALKVGEFVCIDRNNRQHAIQSLSAATQRMQEGVVLWISPEGGRTRNGKLRGFKKGGFMLAMQTDAIIIPVGLRYTDHILPADTLNFCYGQTVEVHVGEPIAVKHYRNEEREQLMQDVRQRILELADLSCTHE